KDRRPSITGLSAVQGRASQQKGAAHVRFGSKADIGAPPSNVRFTPESGHRNSVLECLLCAKSGHSTWHVSQRRSHRARHAVSAACDLMASGIPNPVETILPSAH